MSLSLVTAPAAEPLTVAEARRQLLLNATAGEPAPTAPTVALASPAAPGNCDNGAHRVGFTFVTADGETEIGPLSAVVTVVDKAINGQIDISGISLGGAAVTARRCYLVPVAGGAAKLAATIANNTATTLTLNVADVALGVDAPTVNTTVDPELLTNITAVRERAELATGRALITQTWDLSLDVAPACGWIEIPKPPLQSVTWVKYYDGSNVLQTWGAGNYVVEAPAGPRAARGRLMLGSGLTWPDVYDRPGAVIVRFVAGYGLTGASVPAMLRKAMLMHLGSFDLHREGAAAGTVSRVPDGPKDIYWSYKSHPRQWAAA